MSSSFDLPDPDHLTAGAIGPPGQRVFYLQARAGGQLVSLRLEKQQVAELVRYLKLLLADLPEPGGQPAATELVEPVVAEWVIGTMHVSYDESDDRVELVAEELVPDDAEELDRGVLRLRATRQQVAALAARGAAAVEAGRPICPLCTQPMDPEGHVCPRLNGHRRTP